MATRILITDDHELVRAGLIHFLNMSPDIKVVGEAADGNELLEKLGSAEVDLLLLDMNMPGKSGADLIAHIKDLYPELQILVLSICNEMRLIRRAMKAGASGYISKDCSPQTLLEAIRKVTATGRYLSPQIAEQMAFSLTSPSSDDIEIILSERELEVFQMIVQGKEVREIADQLYISDKTVSTHKNHVLNKLGLKNVAELVQYAMRHNLAS